MSKVIVDQAPIGCVFKATEDCADEDDEDAIYGVSSVVPLTSAEVDLISTRLIRAFRTLVSANSSSNAPKSMPTRVPHNRSRSYLTRTPLRNSLWLSTNKCFIFLYKIAGPTLSALKLVFRILLNTLLIF